MNKEIIIQKAREAALAEIEEFGIPIVPHFESSYQKAIEIAEKMDTDMFVVKLGAILMDFKLGEAFQKGKIEDHVDMSEQAAKEFLAQFDLDKEALNKVLHCIEGHHGTVEWQYPEAEICANADCYRFVLTKNWLMFFFNLGSRDEMNFEKSLAYAEEKLEEKWNIISLDVVEKELQPHYTAIKKIISYAQEK